MKDYLSDTRRSYDATADVFAGWIRGELATKPLDRAVLTAFAELVTGPVADIGCGTGRVTAFLHDLPAVLAGFHRVLAPGGYLQLAFQAGESVVHRTEAGGHRVALDFHHRQPDRMADFVRAAGLTVRATLLRAPDEDGDYPEDTPQAYLLARKPAA